MSQHRRLAAAQVVHRIGDPAGLYPIWSDEGARRHAGRWHLAGDPVIYAAEHLSTAMLEKLAYFQGVLPPNQHRIEIVLPAGVSYEVFAEHQAMRWHESGDPGAQDFGHRWAIEGRSLILFVPSALVPTERNVIVNTAHPDFAALRAGLETPVYWDGRLFG